MAITINEAYKSGWFGGNRGGSSERIIADTWNDIIQLVESKLNTGRYVVDCSTIQGQERAYRECDMVSTVIGKVADSSSNIKIWALDENGKEVKNRLAKSVLEKMNKPNPYEDFGTFFQKADTFRAIYGKAYIQKKKSVLLGDVDYYVIPNYMVTPIYGNYYDSLYNKKVNYYQISNTLESNKLSADEVFVFYDNRISLKDKSTVLGESRLASLSEQVSSLMVLWEVCTELYGDGGAKQIISLGGGNIDLYINPLLKKERKEVQEVLGEYGKTRGKYKSIVTKADAKVHPLTSSIRELGLSETIKNAVVSICNKFDFPPYLIGIDASRYKGMDEAMAQLYTNATIPNAKRYISFWLQMTENSNLPFKIEPDVSHLDFYQNSKQKEAVALQQMAQACSVLYRIEDGSGNRAITLEEVRVKTGLE